MDNEAELSKEVFAQFGRAYCQSEVLHRGLCIMYALATFENAKSITGPRVEEKLAFSYTLTLGQVIEKSKGLFPENIQKRLEFALIKRNYLAHHFWFERNYLMFDKKGLLELHQELIKLTDLFDNLDKSITEFLQPICQSFGLTDELMQQSYKNLLPGEQDKPLISQRPTKKQERIINVWDVKVADNLITQIFETDDGCLWQFCDVGLGWSRFGKPAADWVINEKIQKYLPANINPRPAVSAWNYEFKLSKGAVLWVKPGKREKSYAWGIKAPLR
jgi:hypothetical protein